MINIIKLYNNFKKINLKNKKVILSVSGGIDSMTLLNILYKYYKNNNNLYIAHCNFNLRKFDSKKDEKFVRKISKCYNLNLLVKIFNIKKSILYNKYSLQEILRKIRYKWLFSILKLYNFDYIITAHHLDDCIETFFINFFRSTGIDGMISIYNKKLYRPLLEYSKLDIINYAKYNKLVWREDKSNNKIIYVRNKIRLLILPLIKNIFNNYSYICKKNFKYLLQEKLLIKKYIKNVKNYITIIIKFCPFIWKINCYILLKLVPLHIYIFFLFKKYGFHKQIFNIKNLLNSNFNKKILSSSRKYIMIKYYNTLIISNKINISISNINNIDISFNYRNIVIFNPFFLVMYISNKHNNTFNMFINADLIIWPIRLFTYNNIDSSLCITHNNICVSIHKLIKINNNNLSKKNILVLVDNKLNVICILNYLVNDIYKINNKTINILNILVI